MVDWTQRFAKVRCADSTFGADAPASKPPAKASVARVKGIEKLNKTNLAALARAAKDLGIPVDWLATVISFETGGTFSPTVLNAAGSGAFGLIQFLPSTAQALLKTATKDEAVNRGKAMDFATQLQKMVVPYLKDRRPYSSLDDVYLAIFYPAAKGKASDAVVATAPSLTYEQNKGFDREGKGHITKSDITHRINQQLAAAALLPRIPITTAEWAQILVGLSIVAAGAYYVSVNTNLLPVGPNAQRKFGV